MSLDPWALLQVAVGGVRLGAVYALATLGLVVIHKASKTVNFAHGAFIMLGAYAAWLLLERLGAPYWLVYLIAPATVGAIAAALEYVVLRRLRTADLFSGVVATVFLSLALTEAVRVIFQSDLLNIPGVFAGPPFVVGRLILTPETVWIGAGALATAGLALGFFARSRIGEAMRAVAASARGAELSGISLDRTYVAAWFFGGALAGLAGVFAGPRLGASPELAAATIVPAFVAAVIGGFDSLIGALLGGLILGLIETFAAALLPSALKSAVSFTLLLIALLAFPQGLFPERRVRRV
jgi:branched-chain amino acid transport system permease protein